MSTTSKLTLTAAFITSFGIIGYVHYKQQFDRDKLHDGVLKDVERQQRRKIENTIVLQKQIDLTKQLNNELEQQELLKK